jgi:hypothetical protein
VKHVDREYDLLCLAARRAFDELEAMRSSFDTTGIQIQRAARKHKQLLRRRDALCNRLDGEFLLEPETAGDSRD